MADQFVTPTGFSFQTDDQTQSSFWREYIDNDAPNADSFASRYANATLYAYVPSERIAFYNFVNNILGYANYGDDNLIKRVLPQAHPKYPNLYAFRVTDARGRKWTSKATSQDVPVWQAPEGLTSYSQYGQTVVAVEFAPPKYKIRTDADVTIAGVRKEWMRFVEYDTEPNIYDVTIQTGQFQYAEGTASNPKNKTFPGEVNFLEVKTSMSLVWRDVPEGFLADTTDEFALPTKIYAAAGKVNSEAFDNKPAGTLLLLEPKVDRYVSGTLKRLDGSPVIRCDVRIPLIHFDPPYNDANYRGHNLKPWYKSGDTTIKYYLVTNDGNTTGIRIYGSYDFAKIFEKWSV